MLTIALKNPDIVKKFRERFPKVISKSLDETASFGKSRIMQVTARGATGLAQASWIVKKTDAFTRAIVNTKFYVKFLETGTGLFGPLKKRIVPTSAKALAWLMRFTGSRQGGDFKSYAMMGPKKVKVQKSAQYGAGGNLIKAKFKNVNTKVGMVVVTSTKGMPAQKMIAPNVEIIKADLSKRMAMRIKELWSKLD